MSELSSLDATLSSKIKHYINGGWYFTTLTQIKALFDAQGATTYQPKFSAQYSSPLTGASVQVNDNTSNTHLIVTPAGTIAALTLVLPIASGSSPNATDLQEIVVSCSQIVTALTITGNGATVVGAPTALTAGGFFRLKYDALFTTWNRIG